MARTGGKDRGIVEKPEGSGVWWVRLYVNGREKWFRTDSKSQAKALYARVKVEEREKRYFPEKFDKKSNIDQNSGIMVAHGINHVIEIINEHRKK